MISRPDPSFSFGTSSDKALRRVRERFGETSKTLRASLASGLPEAEPAGARMPTVLPSVGSSATVSTAAAEGRRWFPMSADAHYRLGVENITRLLVVDDNVDVRFAMYEVLSAEGFDVAVAGDGLRGLELARLTRPHAVLLDIGMPTLDGFSTARAMRSVPALSTIPLIAVTGFYDKDHFDRAQSAGFDFYFQKPVAISPLLELLSGRWGKPGAHG